MIETIEGYFHIGQGDMTGWMIKMKIENKHKVFEDVWKGIRFQVKYTSYSLLA